MGVIFLRIKLIFCPLCKQRGRWRGLTPSAVLLMWSALWIQCSELVFPSSRRGESGWEAIACLPVKCVSVRILRRGHKAGSVRLAPARSLGLSARPRSRIAETAPRRLNSLNVFAHAPLLVRTCGSHWVLLCWRFRMCGVEGPHCWMERFLPELCYREPAAPSRTDWSLRRPAWITTNGTRLVWDCRANLQTLGACSIVAGILWHSPLLSALEADAWGYLNTRKKNLT